MKELSEEEIQSSMEQQFLDWFEISNIDFQIVEKSEASNSSSPDFKLDLPNKTFFVECVNTNENDRIWAKTDEIHSSLQENKNTSVLFVAPYMSKKIREKLREYGISWMDLSGNAHIEESPFYIHVEGKKNRFQRPGRRRSVFAPKTSMIPMKFLLNPKKSFTVKQLSEETGLDKSTVSRATRRMNSLGFIREKEKKGRIKPYKLITPNTLLDAWVEDYDFNKHEVMKGALAETGSRNFLDAVQKMLSSYTKQYSLSGPRVAEVYDVPGESSLTVAYVKELPSQIELEKMNFKPGDRGANLWLAQPSSDGPFMETKTKNGIEVVNRIQLYLDLASIKAQRSEELAEELYKKIKKDFRNGGF